MFDKYMICEDTIRNTKTGGAITGFQFGARLPYYRGLGLSMVEEVAVTLDGKLMARDKIRLTVNGKSYTLDGLETEYEAKWEMGDVATVSVELPGGLSPGKHQIELMEQLRVSYMPFPIQGKDSKSVIVAA
jgi:hypothetical protein